MDFNHEGVFMNALEELDGKRILVTGGTGFIGGRLVEILKTEYNVNVRVLVSNFANVARIARFSIDMIKGDICNPEEVDRAVDGCDFVFHCAYGNKGSSEDRRRINIEGTKNILSSSLKHNVTKVVYLSTIMVYGDTPDGEIDETAPRKYSGGLYSDTKLEAENLVFDFHKREKLPVTILQPTAVYGPFSPIWSTNVIDRLKKGIVMLINNGDGLCNGVFIDDMVNAMLLAAVNENSDGNAFIISGEEPITWKEFYGYYENMLGYTSTKGTTTIDAAAITKKLQIKKSLLKLVKEDANLRAKLLETPLVNNIRKTAMSILPGSVLHSIRMRIKVNGQTKPKTKQVNDQNIEGNKPIHPMADAEIKFYKSKSHFKIDKAKRVLGYEPNYSFEAGMKITRQWAESANLLEKELEYVK